LNLKAFPNSASLIFLHWLYTRNLPQTSEISRTAQESLNDTLSETYLLGAALGAPAFQKSVLGALANNLEREEREATRGPLPQYSSAIAWAAKTWQKAEGEVDGRRLREFAVDVAARRVFMTGINGLLLNQEERSHLSGEKGFAGEVFGSLGGQIGMRGVGIGELAKAGEC
jgi:hypothetical protein